MRPLSSIVTAVILAASGLLASGAAAQDFDSPGEQQMLVRVNAMRAAQQLAPLTRNAALDAAARAHSQDMAAHGALTHVSETSGTPADRVRAAGVSATTIAENVALHRTTDEAYQALLASDAHRANMMNADMTDVGLAALRTPQGVYVTQVFAAIPPPAPAEVAEAPVEAAPVEAPPAPADGADCFSPLPGVRICGSLPAPSVEHVDPSEAQQEQEEIVEAPVPPAAQHPVVQAPVVQAPVAQAPAAPAPQLGHPLVVQPGSNGSVVVQRTPDNARVEGYWVYGSGRWWYYPMPASAQPGQRLQPDMSVTGPPPGYPAHPFGTAPQPVVQPRPQVLRVAPPPPIAFRVPRSVAPPAQRTVAPGGAYYTVPPPPMMGHPDRAWRRAHARWMRAYRRWLRRQARARRRAL